MEGVVCNGYVVSSPASAHTLAKKHLLAINDALAMNCMLSGIDASLSQDQRGVVTIKASLWLGAVHATTSVFVSIAL